MFVYCAAVLPRSPGSVLPQAVASRQELPTDCRAPLLGGPLCSVFSPTTLTQRHTGQGATPSTSVLTTRRLRLRDCNSSGVSGSHRGTLPCPAGEPPMPASVTSVWPDKGVGRSRALCLRVR
ncbi:hypothetical protein NDU88_004400 [Pleurodeles waltl]|uniref:Uncharacterized protein n=1 Tax=Pleurodeles waltl TaxID=8319 RepID=A0AAV7TR56_PLEWA|nr:hypothetical protein NDU88_004400 [Pleurodeles waltl]